MTNPGENPLRHWAEKATRLHPDLNPVSEPCNSCLADPGRPLDFVGRKGHKGLCGDTDPWLAKPIADFGVAGTI